MHILLLNSEYPPIGGGAGNASAHLSQALTEMGARVTLVTAHFGNLPRHEKENGREIYRIPALRRRPDRSGPIEQIAFIVSASLWTLSRVPRLKPDITLAFFGVPSGAVAWVLKKLYGIPYVVSLRGGDVPGFRPYDFKTYHRLIGPFLRRIWHEAGAVVANSQGLRQLAIQFEPRLEIPIIPNGVRWQDYATDERLWSPPRLLSVGRVVYQKGLDLALHALAGLKELEWEWYIAGDGPYRATLEALVREQGLQERVHFLGWLERPALIEWYHRANLFLFPSRHEGMPNAVLEAMAAGLPVVATRIAGSEELVLDGLTGRLVPPEDAEALREALRPLLVEAGLRQRMGKAALERVQAHYSWESAARQYLQLLQRVRGV
ncbi:MAG: glycosyltransferase family 4 protein [Anaerolineales bacterium]